MKSIRLRLITLFMVVTTTTLGGFALYEQMLLARELESRFVDLQKDVVARLQHSLVEPLWALDQNVINAKLDAALVTPEVEAVLLRAPDLSETYAGIARNESGLPQTANAFRENGQIVQEASIYPPSHLDDEREKISIGKLSIYFSHAQIDKALKTALIRHILEVILMNLLLLIVLTLSLQMVFTPLRELGEALHGLASSQGEELKELPKTDRSELDNVVEGFNLTLRRLKQIILRRTEAEARAREATEATDRAFVLVKAAQMELIEKNKQLERLSVTDALTGLSNRLKLDQVLASELNRHLRYGSDLGLVMLDIDHFKAVNDTYGHPVGDQVLIELAHLLVAETRNVDCVGRWGGEEFLVICPDTDLDGAVEFAEKLRQAIANHVFPVIGQTTASLGVSSARAGDSIPLLITRADEALYRGKHNGRNRVEKSA